MQQLMVIGIPILVVIVGLLVVGFIFSRMYQKASPETAFMRTGAGKEKVVLNGGALVLPVLHNVTPVNMQSLKLRVRRREGESLVTGDFLRVDADVDFHVRVGQSAEAVSAAATTLGDRTMDVDQMTDLIEPKLVGVLRAVAAKMTLEELHRQRDGFVKDVREQVTSVLEQNGLELESVSLTSLNQTDKRFFSADNVMDVQGLARMNVTVEESKKHINDVTQTNAVATEQRNLEAERQRASIRYETEQVRLEAAQNIAKLTAESDAKVAQTSAEGRRAAEMADIEANQKIAAAQVSAGQALQKSEMDAKTAITLQAQQQAIEVAKRSQEESEATAAANTAKAEAIASEERVTTARAVEVADREKKVAVLAAQKRAEESSIGVVVAAKADKEAAEARADALRKDAEAERDAAVLRAEGKLAEGQAEARNIELKNEADNKLSPEVRQLRERLALLEVLPEVVRETVAPMKNIESIRIAQVGGLTGGDAGGTAGANGSADPVSSMFKGALNYQVAKPMMLELARQAGLHGVNPEDILAGLVGKNGTDGGTGAIDGALVGTEPASAATEA